jgi:hypothetical protein
VRLDSPSFENLEEASAGVRGRCGVGSSHGAAMGHEIYQSSEEASSNFSSSHMDADKDGFVEWMLEDERVFRFVKRE